MCPVCACENCRNNVDKANPLRVASWNIKTLGKQFLHQEPAVTTLLAAIMLRMNADVICLMEVMEGFGPKHAVSIVEKMKELSDTPWRLRFPGTYTGAGGRNGLETYAVVYNEQLFELASFELVGDEFGYSRDASGKRQVDPTSTVKTRRPAQAIFRPQRTCSHFALYPEFRVIIFHAPSVADKDYVVACHAIKALGNLPVFAKPDKFPYTILCADFNLDEEAANHVRRREVQVHGGMDIKSREDAARDIDRYNRAYQTYLDTLNTLEEHRQALANALQGQDPTAEIVQQLLDLRMWNAEYEAAQKSKGKRRQARMVKADEQRHETRKLLAQSDLDPRRGDAIAFCKRREQLEQEVVDAAEWLAQAEALAGPDLPTDEEEVLAAAEAAFEPLTSADMLSNLGYSDDFRTTLRMSVHMACTRQRGATYYDKELTLENFVYSNFDQVLVRTPEGYAWGDIKPQVINLLGAVMPEDVRDRLEIDEKPPEPLPSGMPRQLWARLLELASSEASQHENLRSNFGENYASINPDDIEIGTPNSSVDESGDDEDLVERDYGPIDDEFLRDFLEEPRVLAAALVTSFKRFVDMNNSHPHIELIRREAEASALEEDPIADFFNKDHIWANRATRNAVEHIPEDQKQRLFEINVYLALANVLSDHLPVIVEIDMVKPEWRPVVQPVRPRFPALLDLSAFLPIEYCTSARRQTPCPNFANCCGTCDEQTSLTTSDGCLTGYQLVQAAARVCRQFLDANNSQFAAWMLNNSPLWICGGNAWTIMAGHLLHVKSRSSAFAIAQDTEYFWKNPCILIGRDRIQIDRELCSVRNTLAARKHPRILFAKAKAKRNSTAAQPVVDTVDDDDSDILDVAEDEGNDKNDWSYPRIAREFARRDPVEFAKLALGFLQTGLCKTGDAAYRQALAALLVTMFGVEANKDNSTYLTGILVLLGIQEKRYTIAEVFSQVDPANECNLAGSLGLFPLASSDRSNLEGKRRCLQGKAVSTDAPWNEARIMEAMLNIQPRCRDDIMLKKEMVLLVDTVRARYTLHRLCTAKTLLQIVEQYWIGLLVKYYGDPWR
ncbi:hypothetical protein [Duganella vulcania]|uniref:Uncharacterized protein n=1 Tax=Duganella vulcania TaxID=2692166 RepID=A0A845GWX6_9BURK|nr:hypothetical protein [Duganella vulcania]MYM97778.1 hypothetical protein [Duganella vulcania]